MKRKELMGICVWCLAMACTGCTKTENQTEKRGYNEVCQDYLETMKGYVSSLVTLERSCGLWDIHF